MDDEREERLRALDTKRATEQIKAKPKHPNDKGQRFEVRSFGWPTRGEWSAIGWADIAGDGGAADIVRAIARQPGFVKAEVYDRTDEKVVGGTAWQPEN